MRSRKANWVQGKRKRQDSLLDELSAPLKDFVADFKANGKAVLESVRERNPEKYLELSTKLASLVASLKAEQPDSYTKARNSEELGAALLKSVGISEDQMTADMIAQAVAINEQFVAELERIRDLAQGTESQDAIQ